MDADTAEAVQGLVRMIDLVHQRTALGRLAFDGVVILLASARRQGNLSDVEINVIEQTFAELETDEALERYENVKALFESARGLWNAAAPK